VRTNDASVCVRARWVADDPEIFEMLTRIEARIAKGSYMHAGIAFDPRRERLTSVSSRGERGIVYRRVSRESRDDICRRLTLY